MKNKKFIKFISCFLLTIIFIISISPFYKLSFNTSDSVDGYVFLIKRHQIPHKGELALFKPPENRFYKDFLFLKYVKGIAGDVVTREGRKFYINREYVGLAKETSKSGVPLAANSGGVIARDHYFMFTPHKDSYDSRYKDIGYISLDRIVGTAYRVF